MRPHRPFSCVVVVVACVGAVASVHCGCGFGGGAPMLFLQWAKRHNHSRVWSATFDVALFPVPACAIALVIFAQDSRFAALCAAPQKVVIGAIPRHVLMYVFGAPHLYVRTIWGCGSARQWLEL